RYARSAAVATDPSALKLLQGNFDASTSRQAHRERFGVGIFGAHKPPSIVVTTPTEVRVAGKAHRLASAHSTMRLRIRSAPSLLLAHAQLLPGIPRKRAKSPVETA